MPFGRKIKMYVCICFFFTRVTGRTSQKLTQKVVCGEGGSGVEGAGLAVRLFKYDCL